MKILVTGAHGFMGKNLVAALSCVMNGSDKAHRHIKIDEIFKYDVGTPQELLEFYCNKADFVFHLAGANRCAHVREFYRVNRDLTEKLTEALKKRPGPCPVMLASSVQASLKGRYDNDYGRSKLEAEGLVFNYGKTTGCEVYVYRFPNVFGKWCRPNYNSVIATFCHNLANDLDVKVNDPATVLELLYIDDLTEAMLKLLEGKACRQDNFCVVHPTHKASLGEIEALLKGFKSQAECLVLPAMPKGSFEKKLYSTYVSYLPKEKLSLRLKTAADPRGSFTEILKTVDSGQFSVNVAKAGVTKGQHWHNSKWEIFAVVSGRALIQQRRLDTDEVISLEVSGDAIEAVYMLPGYTHSITNLSDTEDLITLMWANEQFDPNKPDTYFEKV